MGRIALQVGQFKMCSQVLEAVFRHCPLNGNAMPLIGLQDQLMPIRSACRNH